LNSDGPLIYLMRPALVRFVVNGGDETSELIAYLALYRNNRQFHVVRYRWEHGPNVAYQVHIREL